MISNREIDSSIDTSEVKNTFNKKYKWQKYSAVYHPATTTYYWNKYNRVTNTTYQWNKFNSNEERSLSWQTYTASASSRNWSLGSPVSDGSKNVTFTGYYLPSLPTINDIIDISNYALHIVLPSSKTVAFTGKTNAWNRVATINNYSALIGKYICSDNWGLGSNTSFVSIATTNEEAFHFIKLNSIQFKNDPNYTDYPILDNYIDGIIYTPKISITYSKGSTSYGTVSSSSSSAYPTNGRHTDGFWYDGRTSSTSYSKGTTSYGTVSSTSRSAYPDNNYSGSYWYVYSRSSTSSAYYSKGAYIEDVVAKEEDEYPTNGRHTDGYWYVKIE